MLRNWFYYHKQTRSLAASLTTCITLNSTFSFVRFYINNIHYTSTLSPHAHLPARLLVIIVADTSGVGEQRAGERWQPPSLRTLTWTQDTNAAHSLSIYRAVTVNNHTGASHWRVLWTGTFCGEENRKKWKGEGDGDRNRRKSEIREKMTGEDKGQS